MSDIQDNQVVKNLVLNNCQNVIIGDGTNITNSVENQGDLPYSTERTDVDSNAQNSFFKSSILPERPFHICQKRTKELTNITSMFESMTSSSCEAVVTAVYLTGPPGSGKTQLARQYGEHFLKTTPSCKTSSLLALTCNADSVQSLVKSLKDIAKKLGLTMEAKTTTEGSQEMYLVRFYLEEIRKFLQRYRGLWLLILDDMRHGEEINLILPLPGSKDWGTGKILVTSQDNDIVPACHQYARMKSLNSGMTKEDALDLLNKVTGIDVDDFAVELVKELEFSPLALACSATYVGQRRQDRASTNFSWKQFLALHRVKKHQLEYRTFSKNNVYSNSMAAAAGLAVERMTERSDVLRLTFNFLSYCALQPVPLVLLANFVQTSLHPGKSLSCEEIESEISRCSLLIHAQSGFSNVETVKSHQVMSDVFQRARDERCGESNESEFVAILKFLNEYLKPATESLDQLNSIAIKILMRPHLKSFVDHANAKNWNTTAEFVLISMKVGQFLYDVTDMPAAKLIECLESMRIIAAELKLSDIQYCDILANLGFYKLELYFLEESLEILNDAYAMTDSQTTKEWLVLKCRILNNISRNYYFLEKYDLAVENMRRSIDIAKDVYSDDEDQIMDRFLQLLLCYIRKDEVENVKKVVDEGDEFFLNSRKTDCKSLKRASSLCTVACLLVVRWSCSVFGQALCLTMAESFYAQSMKMYEDVLGEDIYSCSVVGYQLIQYAWFCNFIVENQFLASKLVHRAQRIFNQSQDKFGLSYAAAFTKNALNAKRKVTWITFLIAPLFSSSGTMFVELRDMHADVLEDCKSGKISPSRRCQEPFRMIRSMSVKGLWYIRIWNFGFWMIVVALIAYFCERFI